jgi:hypothetical protein
MADGPTKVIITGGTTDTSTIAPQPPFQGQQSFVQRLIELTISLQANQQTNQPNKFAGTDSDTITLSGFRTSVRIENSGGVDCSATVSIYGLAPNLVNQLSTLGMIFDMVQKNSITISAGDAQAGLTPVFTGTIAFAFPDFSGMPQVAMHFECRTGLIAGTVPIPASSFPGSTDVATIMAGFARQIPAGFENNGVTIQLPSSYFPGTLRDQIRECAEHAHINAEILPGSGGQQVLAIWPIGSQRNTNGPVPLVSKDTGMIGAPSFAPNGYAVVKSLFNPQIAFGGVIHITSVAVPQANRDWVVQRLSLALDSLVPKGRWDATMICYPKGFAAPVPPQGGGM